MNIKVADLKEDNDVLTFTLSGVDFSYANALKTNNSLGYSYCGI